jgi:siroheme synthase-like protein
MDFNLQGKQVVVVGGGLEGYRKTSDFLQGGAKVSIISQKFTADFCALQKTGKISLKTETITDTEAFLAGLDFKPDVLVAVTDNHELNLSLIRAAKSRGWIVYAPDNPALSDFSLPAVANVGEVKIAVSTGGKSPAMASVLRKRIEQTITAEDLLQIRLQVYLRSSLKKQIKDQKDRKKSLYRILQNRDIKALLKEGKLEEAKKKATAIAQETHSP